MEITEVKDAPVKVAPKRKTTNGKSSKKKTKLVKQNLSQAKSKSASKKPDPKKTKKEVEKSPSSRILMYNYDGNDLTPEEKKRFRRITRNTLRSFDKKIDALKGKDHLTKEDRLEIKKLEADKVKFYSQNRNPEFDKAH